MNVIALCPAKVATGGTEAIHQLVHELNKYLDAVILYPGAESDPQPPQYEHYGCDYIRTLPEGYKGIVIFPEIWADAATTPQHKDCIKVINWAGWDVYQWNVPLGLRWRFLEVDAMHIAQSAYATDNLRRLGIEPMRLSDIIGDEFFEPYDEEPRNDVILYNPSKITDFEKKVIKDAPFDFRPIHGMSRGQIMEALRHAKLYIDFNLFSGRERLLREAVMCGCCALVSTAGCSAYYEDISIPDRYKFDMFDDNIPAVHLAMADILKHYDDHRQRFDVFRESIIADQNRYPDDVRAIAEAFKERLNAI